MMTASRSRNIRFFLVFQSLQQIEKKYRGSAHIIIGNCDCIAYLNSKDMELLTYISQLAGTYRRSYVNEECPLISVTQTIDTYVYRGLMQTNNIGMSSAAGVYQSVVGFVLVISANLIVRRLDKSSALF